VRDHKPNQNTLFKPQDSPITPNDWAFIELIHTALRAFDQATVLTEGHEPVLSDWYISIHELMRYINDWKAEVRILGDNDLKTRLVASWNKLEKYYLFADQAPVYYAAILLNPCLKREKLVELWQANPRRIEQAVNQVRQIWQRHYRPKPQATTTTHIRLSDGDSDAFGAFLANSKRRCIAVTPAVEDAFEAYLLVDAHDYSDEADFDVISWWLQRQHIYPGLTKMAFDVFAIPVMNDDSERALSASNDMVTKKRNKLNSDTIEACQCLRSWYQLNKSVFDEDQAIEVDIPA
jgi:hypothetical protein